MSSTDRPILVIEDDTDDLFLLQKAFEKSGLTKELMVARDGEMAIEVLSNGNTEQPALVILDLKLPRKSGFEVLEWMDARGAGAYVGDRARPRPSGREMPTPQAIPCHAKSALVRRCARRGDLPFRREPGGSARASEGRAPALISCPDHAHHRRCPSGLRALIPADRAHVSDSGSDRPTPALAR
jgi:CheY-like chemotaxis protein